MNKIMLIGRAGITPKLIKVKGNKKLAQFSVAINDTFPTIQWFNILAWDQKAEEVAVNLKKGNQVFVEGSLVVQEYTDKMGIKGKIVQIILRDFRVLDTVEKGVFVEQ